MHATSIDIYIQSLWRTPWIPKWHSCQNSKAARPTMIAWEQTKHLKKWPLTNELYCRLRAWQLHRMQISKCILAVCTLTLAFLKVSIRVCGVCMEHIACHLAHFTPLRNARQSICQRSILQFVGLLSVQYIAPWDFGNSATMSLRNLHVHYGGSYVSHNIAIYTAHRRSIYIYIYRYGPYGPKSIKNGQPL